ncbi:DUF5336 domain-containing protein [Haloechinothrix salitolerans]|uniref:DUF5336 domain-containing protein n=1 Tax=Haloechinothrix salitolerans TaxID=926830 RepID=A0ABW2CB24_9PSEU
MTYPSGGFPGQGPQHQPPPQQQGGQFYQQQPQQNAGRTLDIGLIAYLAVAGLGVLNLFFGFATLGSIGPGTSVNFFEAFTGWVPGLLFIAALTAAFGVLPGDHKPGAWPAVFSLGAIVPFLFMVFSTDGELETGGVLMLIFGIVQALVAVGAYLIDVGLIKLPRPGQQQPAYGQQPGYGQQGQFGQYGQPQQGAYPQQHGQPQPGHPQTPAPGQQLQGHAGASGGQPGQGQPGQPGAAGGQPQSGQAPTLYASPQGQFTQQPPQQG